jgi:hypothetical protein
MTTKTLVTLAAGLEVATGVALSLSPTLVVRVLFGADLSDGGVAVGRVGGFALLSLAIACWPHKDAFAPATRALFLFNLLAALNLGYFKVGGSFCQLPPASGAPSSRHLGDPSRTSGISR